MTRIKYFSLRVYLIVLLAVTGCSSSINIKAGKDNTQDILLSLDLGEAVSRTILSATKGMQKMSGKETSVFSKNHIESGLKKANVVVNRKMLAELAVSDPKAFTEIVKVAEKASK